MGSLLRKEDSTFVEHGLDQHMPWCNSRVKRLELEAHRMKAERTQESENSNKQEAKEVKGVGQGGKETSNTRKRAKSKPKKEPAAKKPRKKPAEKKVAKKRTKGKATRKARPPKQAKSGR